MNTEIYTTDLQGIVEGMTTTQKDRFILKILTTVKETPNHTELGNKISKYTLKQE